MAELLQLKKAQRSQAYIKIGMSAPSGGGKTFSSILLAYGLVKGAHPDWKDDEIWNHIAIIDTENGSGQLYVGSNVGSTHIGSYNVVVLKPPFEADKYIQAIDLCQQAGMEVCIIDSSTHLWSGEGGLLEQQSNAAKRSGNSYTAWRDITPQHNHFVEKMLQVPMHIIATMRAKEEYVMESDSGGKTNIRKVGMEPEQRKGMQYEFTIFFELTADHTAYGSKDRTSLFDGRYFVITPETGLEIVRWLSGSTNEEPVILASVEKANPKEAFQAAQNKVIDLCKKLGGSENKDLMKLLKENTPDGKGNPNSIKDPRKLTDLYIKIEDLKRQQEQELVKESQPA